MKTTDRKEIKKGQYYYMTSTSLNKIKKVKCTYVNPSRLWKGITSWCYLSTYPHEEQQFHRKDINGCVYGSYDKAKSRLVKLIKNTIKNYKNMILQNQKILEKL